MLLHWVFAASWPLFSYSIWQLAFKDLRARARSEDFAPSILLLRDLREGLLSGTLPSRADWQRLEAMPRPWGRLVTDCVGELRESGLPVVPTLERMEKLLRELEGARLQARARTSQAWAQAWVCGSFIPLTAIGLYGLLPGVKGLGAAWAWAAAAALLLDGAAMLWLVSMSERARWAGLARLQRPAWPALLCFGERFLASLRAGTPPDLAWTRAIPQLSLQAPELVVAWGAELWSSKKNPALGQQSWMLAWGEELRAHLQRSVMEGRPCTERVESALQAVRAEWTSRVEKELQLLAARALKPLFLLVAPALFGLLVLGLVASIQTLEMG